MIFFPILQGDHFWLIVFNLKKPVANARHQGYEFLGRYNNSAHDAVFDEKYMFIPQTMQRYLTRYMEMVHYPRIDEIKALKGERWDMECRTLNNKIDCGVFLMRHMEVYKGEQEGEWDCDIGMENAGQQQTLNRLRAHYVTKILLSDVNLCRNQVQEESENFVKIPIDDQEEILFKAKLNMKVRWG